MLIAINREARPEERRVALVPRSVADLVASGHSVTVPPGAGVAAGFDDEAYREAGATVGDPPETPDLVVTVGPPHTDIAAKAVLGFLDPLGDPNRIQALADRSITALAIELVPRTTQAQSMDALSSQATSVGYEAVILGAEQLPRFLPMLMTAAGTIPPARVLVLGAGVAGLQALATARRLGAIVSGYDIRPAAKEQVESLGAEFVGGPVAEDAETQGGYAGEVDEQTRQAQQAALAEAVAAADIVIATAQVPGRKAPILLTADMVKTMRPGAVVVDTAASTGGNCELTEPAQIVVRHGVKIAGPLDLAGRTAGHTSEMYSRNLTTLIDHLVNDDLDLVIDAEDDIGTSVCVARDGRITNDRVRAALEDA